MKKKLLLLCIFLGGVFSFLNASEVQDGLRISFQVMGVDPTIGSSNIPRGPIIQPDVYQDGSTLYLYNVDCVLSLVVLNEDGEMVYFTTVLPGTNSVMLPNTIEGNCVLQLYPGGNYYLEGEITL